MFYLFYLTRNYIGLILVLSPMAGLLYRYSEFTLSMVLMCFAAAAVSLTILKARWTSRKAFCLAAVWSISLAAGRLWYSLMERNTYLFFAAAAAAVAAGIFFFVEKPVWVRVTAPAGVRRRGTLKIMLFSAAMSFSGSVSFLAAPPPDPFDFFISAEAVFAAGLIAGPVIAGLISDTKGVYACSVFMIFISELAAACATYGNSLLLLHFINRFACGIFMSGIFVNLPLLASYLYDPESMPAGILSAFVSAAAGVLTSIPSAGDNSVFFIITVFAALSFAFFTLFSAWKHRLFLLKKPEI